MVLTEALVAIATLAIAVTALGTITQNSIATTILAKDYLVARGLAKEGEEAVKNIRYTNWMRNPADSTCWLRFNMSSACPSAPAQGHYYIPSVNNGYWSMADQGTNAPNLSAVSSPFRLVTDGSAYYTSKTGATNSKFYRSVFLSNLAGDNSSATFNIQIQWQNGAKTMSISRSITMYNYL